MIASRSLIMVKKISGRLWYSFYTESQSLWIEFISSSMEQSSVKSLLQYQWLLWLVSSNNKRSCQCKASRYSSAFENDDPQMIRVAGSFTGSLKERGWLKNTSDTLSYLMVMRTKQLCIIYLFGDWETKSVFWTLIDVIDKV